VAFLKLEPQDSTDDAIDPTRALNEPIVDDAGFDVEPLETSDRWLAEAERFSAPSVAAAPNDPFEELTGRRATYLAGVGARLYWSFCLPIETVARLTGVAFTPGRSLWPARYDADKLAEAQRVREEAEKVEEDKRAAKKAEIERLKTIEEVGAQVVAVSKDRPHSGDGPAPWKGAALLWSTDSELFYGFRKLRGLDLPELGGELRVLAASDFVPATCAPVPEANASALGFARYARQHAGSPGRGPIEQWSTEGLARAKELAAQFAPTFLYGTKAYLWGHCAECLVRGLLVFPTMAESLIRAAIRAEEIRRSPPIKVPSQFAERASYRGARLRRSLFGGTRNPDDRHFEARADRRNDRRLVYRRGQVRKRLRGLPSCSAPYLHFDPETLSQQESK
jgi:hypothetical protein